MLLVLSLLTGLALAATPDPRSTTHFCDTFSVPDAQFLDHPPPPPPPEEEGGRTVQSWFPEGPSRQTSEHFVLHWGDDQDFDEAQATRVLDLLEESWDVYVDEYGHQPPEDSDIYYINAYIGSSFDGAPELFGGTAYRNMDPDGRSYLVFNADRLGDDPDWVAFVAAHETYHVFQYPLRSTRWDTSEVWWLEATAQSMSYRLTGDERFAIDRVRAWVFYPYLPLDDAQSLDYEVTSSMHRYGAYLFTEDLIDELGTDAIVRTFQVPAEGGPLEQMRTELDQVDADLDRVFMRTVTSTLTGDRRNGEAVAAHLEAHSDEPEAAGRFTIEVPPGGTDALAPAPTETLPGSYAWNVLRWSTPEPGTYRIHVLPTQDERWDDLQPELHVELVQRTADGSTRQQTLAAGTLDSIHPDVQIDHDVEEAYVVVAFAADLQGYLAEGGFAYEWQVQRMPDPYEEAGCACSTSTGPLSWTWLALPLLTGLARRRRPSHRS